MIATIPRSFAGSYRQANQSTEIDLAVYSFSTFFIVFILLHPFPRHFFLSSLIHCKIPSWFEPVP